MSIIRKKLTQLKRNFKISSVFILALTITATISYSFSAIQFNESLLKQIQERGTFQTGIVLANIIIFCFLIIFAIYTNRFYIKQRQKELGMLLVFGESELKISLKLLGENLLFTFTACITGMLAGGFFSKIFGTILVRLMGYSEEVSVSFPVKATLLTIGLMIALLLILSVQNYLILKHTNLVELFTQRNKTWKYKKPKLIESLLSIILIGCAYYLSFNDKLVEDLMVRFMVQFGLVLLGIILFFHSTMLHIFSGIQKRPNYYHTGAMLWIAPLRSKLSTNIFQLTLTTIISTTMLYLTTFTLFNYRVQFDAPRIHLPDDIQYSQVDNETQSRLENIYTADQSNPVASETSFSGIPFEALSPIKNAFTNPKVFQKDGWLFSLSAFKKIIKERGNDAHQKYLSYELADNQAISFSGGEEDADWGKAPHSFAVKTSEEAALAVRYRLNTALLGWMTQPEIGMQKKAPVLIVSDNFYKELEKTNAVNHFHALTFKNGRNAADISKKMFGELRKSQKNFYFSSYADVAGMQIESSALLFFSSALLAVIAFFSLGAMIYFKQLQDAFEDQPRFRLLSDMGINAAALKRSIYKQEAILFILPSIIGTINSLVLIKPMLEEINQYNLLPLLIGILLSYFVIYTGLFISSSKLYYRTAAFEPGD